MKRNNKGFTLIEIVVAVAILSTVGIILSYIVGSASRYYTASESIKNTSDSLYEDVLDTSSSSGVKKDSKLTFTATKINKDTKEAKSEQPITINDLSSKQKSATVDDTTFTYLSFVNTKALAGPLRISNTVIDRYRYLTGNYKGAWIQNQAGSYHLGDFVTYQDRTYLLVTQNNQQTNGKYNPPGGQNISGWQLMDANVPTGSIFTYYLAGDIFIDNGKVYVCTTNTSSNDLSGKTRQVGTYESGNIDFTDTLVKDQWQAVNMSINGQLKETT